MPQRQMNALMSLSRESDSPESPPRSRSAFTVPRKTLNEQAECRTNNVPETANTSLNVAGNCSLASQFGLRWGRTSLWRRSERRFEFVRRLSVKRFRTRSGGRRMSQCRSHARVVESPPDPLRPPPLL